MNLKEGSVLYVRTDCRASIEEVTEEVAMASMVYLQTLAKERFLVAGCFGNMELCDVDGAMVLFEAEDMEEAKRLSDKDPVIQGGFYRYEIQKWNIMLATQD